MSRMPAAAALERASSAPPQVAGTADAPVRLWHNWAWRDLPSWLASVIVHSTLLVALGLIYTKAVEPPKPEMLLDWSEPAGTELGGGGGGTPGDLSDELEVPKLDSELPTDGETPQALSQTDPLEAETTPLAAEWGSILPVDASSQALSDVVDPLATSAGSGRGGKGAGDGGSGGGLGGGDGGGFGDGIGPGSGPGSGRTSVFGLVGEGSSFVYVFDRSESMNSVFTLASEDKTVSITPLEAAKKELARSVEDLRESNEFQIIFYNDEPLLFSDQATPEGIFKATKDNKRLAKYFIEQLEGAGNTNHVAALEAALQLKPEVIFLLTDGEEKDDLSTSQLRYFTKIAKRTGTKINVIHFAYVPRPNSSLASLAKQTHGQFISISIRSLANSAW